ncbi:hypothetical protein APS67_006303 [Streptomyces sp. AVP053U2]|nr:hypothetical protein APS67_006303 [Streptomyces sp. AVP053U2]
MRMEPAPLLGMPLTDPDPAPGCTQCRRWARQRQAARAGGDWTQVSDCNVRIRRCTH